MNWTDIPSCPLGAAPDNCMPPLYPCVRAKRAMAASYEEADVDSETAIQDLLSDLRHLCDALELDFHEIDRAAHGNYAAELSPEAIPA